MGFWAGKRLDHAAILMSDLCSVNQNTAIVSSVAGAVCFSPDKGPVGTIKIAMSLSSVEEDFSKNWAFR